MMQQERVLLGRVDAMPGYRCAAAFSCAGAPIGTTKARSSPYRRALARLMPFAGAGGKPTGARTDDAALRAVPGCGSRRFRTPQFPLLPGVATTLAGVSRGQRTPDRAPFRGAAKLVI